MARLRPIGGLLIAALGAASAGCSGTPFGLSLIHI